MGYSLFSVKKFYTCLTLFTLIAPGAWAQEQKPVKKTTSPIEVTKTLPSATYTPPVVIPTPGAFEEKMILDMRKIFDPRKIDVMGPRTGGGGNSCSLAIVENTSRLSSQLNMLGEELLTKPQLAKVQEAIKTAKFFTAKRLVLGGESKDAINYPLERKIIVSENFCATEMIEPSGRSMSLLLHEFLGLAEINDRQYQISRDFLNKYSAVISEDYKIRKLLEAEAAKDMKGQRSCFNGELRKKDRDMKESYGGRYSSDMPGISFHQIGEDNYRSVDKYCDGYLDKNRKPTDDDAKRVYDVCHSSNKTQYAVSAGYGFSTSGTYGTEAVLFNVWTTTNVETIVDRINGDYQTGAGYESSTSDIELTCEVLKMSEPE